MPTAPPGAITALLERARGGDQPAVEQFVPLVVAVSVVLGAACWVPGAKMPGASC